MIIQELLFFAFAAVITFSSLMVIFSSNAVRSALFLVLAFVSSSGVWLLAHAEFLALILVLVYVGAVMTLFLFVIMMIDTEKAALKKQLVHYFPVGMLVVVTLVGLMVMALKPAYFAQLLHLKQAVLHPEAHSNTAALGSVLYTEYLYPFELAAALLLVAIISAISLAHRKPRECKTQNLRDQLQVKRNARVRLVDPK